MKWWGLVLLWISLVFIYNVSRWGLVYGTAVMVVAMVITVVLIVAWNLIRDRFTKKPEARHLR